MGFNTSSHNRTIQYKLTPRHTHFNHLLCLQGSSIMCQVTSFFCGAVDLKKSPLIIGSIKLVLVLMQVVYFGQFYIAIVPDLVESRYNGDPGKTWVALMSLKMVEYIAAVIVNALVIHEAKTSEVGAGRTLAWLIVTMIGIVTAVLGIIISGQVVGLFVAFVGQMLYVDIAASIYFFIVIMSYRSQLKSGAPNTV